MTHASLIEPLEARIAPATLVANPIFDVTATTGQKGVSIDLGTLVDPSKSYRTLVEFQTNYIPSGATEPGVITLELFDDKAPVAVANFLRYLNNSNNSADYDGVFFHRLVAGFVLQGGGFNATDTSTHIDTFSTVHNEFDPDDAERSNVVQTVAMAKVGADQGGGAHSATSEFFINLANNASNLDGQNGGFTVFGRVTDNSMPLVNEIAGLQTSGNFPVQDYSGGSPTPDQLIQIVDARVIADPGDDSGYSFSVTAQDAVSGLPTNLVTAKVNPKTGDLDVTYSTKLNGTAKVIVSVSKDGVTETDEFLVTVKPNLISEVNTDGLSTTFVPGDTGTAKVKVTNNGGALAKGRVNVKLYLSESNFSNGSDPLGFALDTDKDLLLGEAMGLSINVAAGKSATLPVKFSIPSEGLTDGKRYRVLAVVETADGSTIQELFVDDNIGNFRLRNASLDDPQVLRTFDVAFGSVGGRNNVPVTVADADGNLITFKLKGSGTGTVSFDGDDIDISIAGTNASTTLLATTAKGIVANIDDLFINQTVGNVNLGNIHLHGHFTASGGAKSIAFNDLGNTDDSKPEDNADHTLSIGVFPTAGQKLKATFGSVRDYSLTTNMQIASLNATEWLNDPVNTVTNAISAASIGNLKISGDFEADIIAVGDTKTNLIDIKGTLRDATIRTLGDIGTIKLGDLSGSTILAGLLAEPTALGDFGSAKNIASITVKGTIADSTVAAAQFNSVNVNAVDGDAGTETGGFLADAIKSYVRKGAVSIKKQDAASTFDTVAPNYEARVF